MTFSRALFYFCLAFLGGVFAVSFLNPGFYFYFLIIISGLIIFFIFYKREIAILGICFLIFLLGVFWEERFEAESIPEPNNIHYFNDRSEITFEGIICGEPKEKMESTQIIVEGKKIVDNDSNDDKLVRGKVLITLPPGVNFSYGDKLRVKGKLQPPEKFTEDFNWPEYLRKDRIYSTVYNPEIKLISSGNGNKILVKIFSFKERLKETAKILLPPQGAILSAITLGDKTRLSGNFKDKLSRAGLSHITAISGMHIMVLFGIFLFIFLWIGLWRWQATVLTLAILVFYILMIGVPPSAVRAGIMGGLLYLGLALGRLNQSSRAIVFAATGMILQNPLILTRDVGFQLSFLASLGIIYLFPILKERFGAKDSKVKELICLTFAAQIFCFPFLIFNFGQAPILAPISNILVIPLLPFLLGAGFLFLLLSLLLPQISFFLSFLIWPLFAFVVKVVEGISSIPFSAISLNLHWSIALIFYIIIGYFILEHQRKNKVLRTR